MSGGPHEQMVTNMNRLLAATLLGTVLSLGALAPAFAGTAATVNGVAIDDRDVAARVSLMKLEGGGSTSKALDALITEQLQIQEATRLGIQITDQQVNDAFAQVARNVKLSTDKLTQLLRANGVGDATMKSRLRAALAWQGVSEVAIKSRVQISDLELDTKAQADLTPDMSFDYVLKEIMFITAGKSASARTSEANKYRASFQGCDSAVDLSLKYTDVAVRDVGRRHATQLPEAQAKELGALKIGGITKPRVVEGSVSMLAICDKAQARDTTYIKSKLRNEVGSEAYKTEVAKYLEELRKKAKITKG
jgi:peptidyl-prolyl cis-trans isomerase SurA